MKSKIIKEKIFKDMNKKELVGTNGGTYRGGYTEFIEKIASLFNKK